jgi:transcription elongation factor Elf1
MNLGQNTVETYKILKEQMEKIYQNTLFKPDYCVDRESIFKVYILLLSVGTWEPDSRYEISLGELFGIFMSIYHFWVRPVRQLKGDALSDYIGELFFSARELSRNGINNKATQSLGELACGKDESILKVFFWGSWILDTSSNSVFQCTLKEKGVKVRFNCMNCGHEYMRDTIEIGQKITCVECEKEIIVPSIKQRHNLTQAVQEHLAPCKYCGQQMEKIDAGIKKWMQISGILLFLTGLTIVLMVATVRIAGSFLILAGIGLTIISMKIWHCPNCGFIFKR